MFRQFVFKSGMSKMSRRLPPVVRAEAGEGSQTFVLKAVQDLIYPIFSLWNEESNRGQRIRRLSIFVGWQLWKRIIRKPITVALFNGRRFIAYPDCAVSSGVLYTRIPDSRNILFLRKHVSSGTLIDVGANVGSVSLLLSDTIESAILFEPNPVAAARARENLALNRLAYKVYETALSDTNGEIHFECHGAVDSTGHVVVSAASSRTATCVVQCVTSDEFLRQHGDPDFPVSLVKIDVEGHENSVLRGMRQFLAGKRPPLVMFEYLQRTNIEETLSFFEGVGYQVFELGASGPVAVAGRVEPLQDLFACPSERMPAMGMASSTS
jgi:FkbM family methyltransferase